MEFIDDASQLKKTSLDLINRGVDAIVATSSGTIYENIHLFLDEANETGVPVFSFYKTGVEEGAVAALSSDFFRMAEVLLLPMAAKVLLDKVNPGDLPAAFLDRNILYVNGAQLKRFGLTVPPELEEVHDVVYLY